ncbi:MAG: S-formylglutathione hydrolase [Gammaproteobacteria bacterium]|nr:S-formylglutathione hydrolase [Gammaproteobacteria bacterium]
MTLEQVASTKSFGGQQLRYKHASIVLGCDMHFSIFLPPRAQTEKVPVIYWLSGLTCTDENFVQKAGAQQYASEQGVAIIAPDTSPRGEDVPDDSEASYDFGLGAGFYVNATQEPWARHYRMYDYITAELPGLIAENFSVDVEHSSIMGHSMGGHGALTIALKNPGKYKSVSAFSPICSPMNCPWGEKALANYIGDNREAWREYDACELIKTAPERLPILVDQGNSDDFMEEQLKPWLLKKVCEEAGQPLELRMQEGYDHSYFFIASFIEEHIKHHALALVRN